MILDWNDQIHLEMVINENFVWSLHFVYIITQQRHFSRPFFIYRKYCIWELHITVIGCLWQFAVQVMSAHAAQPKTKVALLHFILTSKGRY